MKGYVVDSGYMGYVDGRYVLFADENDYIEVYKEMQNIMRQIRWESSITVIM